MTPEEKLERELRELNRLTGISFSLDENENPDAEELSAKIKLLSEAFREKNSRTAYFRKLLGGQLELSRVYEGAARLHLPAEGRMQVFVVETENVNDEGALMVLRQIAAGRSQDHMVPVDGKRIALIRRVPAAQKEADALRFARTIIDMLNAEAMVRARCAFSECVPDLAGLPEAYREACLALEIGRIFYMNETILRSSHLGIGQLIYRLPEDVCRRFLREVFSDKKPEELDEETRLTVEAFFENNLNISETARKLFIHRNTLVYRLEKLKNLSGLDVRVFEDAMIFRIASMIASFLREEKNEKSSNSI
ncbi:MAG: helix-turn-helix domain-containing protein [Lachnospiraceae bacterium]|nr:helix-turn-helix domain-containing protein [Lachnospiraceae bacterium]